MHWTEYCKILYNCRIYFRRCFTQFPLFKPYDTIQKMPKFIRKTENSLTEVLRSCDHASLMYSSKTNKMQCYTMVFIIINALHVSGGSSAHHQELKTVYTALGICRAFLLLTTIVSCSNSLTIAVRRRKSSTNTRCCVYSFELLMMCGGTA